MRNLSKQSYDFSEDLNENKFNLLELIVLCCITLLNGEKNELSAILSKQYSGEVGIFGYGMSKDAVNIIIIIVRHVGTMSYCAPKKLSQSTAPAPEEVIRE